MRGGPSPWARVGRLEAAGLAIPTDVRAEAARVAAARGLDPAALLAEAAALAERCLAAGAVTPEQMAALVAAESGGDAATLLAEVLAEVAAETAAGWAS